MLVRPCLHAVAAFVLILDVASVGAADTHIRIVPVDGAVLAAGQRFDLRVEATSSTTEAPRQLLVTIDDVDVSARNILAADRAGERGRGGTGTAAGITAGAAGPAPSNTTNLLIRELSFAAAGRHVIAARTADGASARVTVDVEAWDAPAADAGARNIIFILGDGMGAAHRAAARIVSRGVTNGRANRPLAMDTMEVTGQVMTYSLNSVITDSSPGMSSYVTGHKANNNQEGVYPDNTPDPFDNPRVEYVAEVLRRQRGDGFSTGIVTTADVTDATPAANAVHTANRNASTGIAERFFDERDASGLRVLLGGGRQQFVPKALGGARTDTRDLVHEFAGAGFDVLSSADDVQARLRGDVPPGKLLGLFHPTHMAVAFDKVGTGLYSTELQQPNNATLPRQPMLDDMVRLAISTLDAHSPAGFYLLVEGASIDKQAHAADAERTVWDTIELDNAVAVALDFARRTNTDADPGNDTLVIVTADHEGGGMAIIGVGNERYQPSTLGRAVRDYAAVFRFAPEQTLNFVPNYEVDAQGFPIDPDPSRKLLITFGAAPDRYENWTSNRLALPPAIVDGGRAVANPARDGAAPASDNQTIAGAAVAGFLIPGAIEDGSAGCPTGATCPGDTQSSPQIISGHTASDIPLSASGPGAWQFTGTFDNTAVFLKLLRAATGNHRSHTPR